MVDTTQSTSIELKVRTVVSVDLADTTSRARARAVVEQLEENSASTAKSKLLSRRITALAEADSGSVRVASDLHALAVLLQQKGLRPSHQRKGLLHRLFKPEKNPVDSAGSLYEARAMIDGLLRNLTASVELLRQNEIALQRYEADVLAEHKRVTADIEVADEFERALLAEIAVMKSGGAAPDVVRFVEQEVLFPVERLRQNLQTLLAVNQQGAFSIALLRENNTALLSNVQQIVAATKHSLDVAALVHRMRADQYASEGSVQGPSSGHALVAQDSSVDDAFAEAVNQLLTALGNHEAWYGGAVVETEKALVTLEDLSAKVTEPTKLGVLS